MGKPRRNLWIFAGTGLELSHDYTVYVTKYKKCTQTSKIIPYLEELDKAVSIGNSPPQKNMKLYLSHPQKGMIGCLASAAVSRGPIIPGH